MPPSPDNNPPPRARLLEQFRASSQRRPLHQLELAALVLVAAHLVFLPWAIGGMPLWTQVLSAALAVAGLAVALLPRELNGDDSRPPTRMIPWPRLLRFPIFWLGLAMLGYIALQGLNPAWTFRSDAANFWLERIPHRPWLPTGVDAPFERWNAWRSILVFGSAWLVVCTIWVAFTRRRTVQLLLVAVAVNGTLLAVFAVVQKILGNGKIYWSLPSPNLLFFGSFIYKNHAGAYLHLAFTAAVALAAWYYARGVRRHEKSNPAGLFAFFALGIAVSILASYARGATIIMLAFAVACAIAFVLHRRTLPPGTRNPAIGLALLAVFGVFLVTGWKSLRSRDALEGVRQGITRQDRALETRGVATTAALGMLAEHHALGVGAGAFRYVFPIYQARHPELTLSGGERRYWEHAHNDLVQFPIELGLPGTALGLLGFGWLLLVLVRNHFWEKPLGACGTLGLGLLLAYAWWDFPFQCPAILITWCALWPALALWVKFEEQNARG
ncbi:MAG: O-antigen ligase family protein [Opitutaceae bacterium]|nr:O-antigen ligase family protein [Opitutaceae bacterium]